MVERKDQLRNVAFGGNWSEEILIVGELRQLVYGVSLLREHSPASLRWFFSISS